VEIPLGVQLENMADEAVIAVGDEIVTFDEVNGSVLNPAPAGHVFTTGLTPAGSVPFPSLEYRVTDASSPDEQGRFWVINYFYPDDTFLLRGLAPTGQPGPEKTPGAGPPSVERLIELKYSPGGIHRTATPPLELVTDGSPHNWEGIAHWPGKGFILATDKFPVSMLGFVRYP
jgi:hypothetical protein